MPSIYAENCHRIYAEPWIIETVDQIAKLNKARAKKRKPSSRGTRNHGASRSAIICIEMIELIRREMPRLRRAGIPIPKQLFELELRRQAGR
jgi:hypothetical protein